MDGRMVAYLTRRQLLRAGLVAGATFSMLPLGRASLLSGGEAASPKRGGILRVRGWDPVHFDPHLTRSFRTHTALSFVYSKLLRHKVGADVRPGTFIVEPDLAERWEEPDDTTYIFHLRRGVKWHNKPPVNGRELVAEDVKFTFDRFLTEKGNPERQLLDSVDRVEVVDRYTVKFLLKEPFVWLLDILANAMMMWIIAPEVVEKYGDLKKVDTAIGTGPFLLERYEPNVKTIFRRNPDYFRPGVPYVDGVEWLVMDDESTALAVYRTGQIDAGPWNNWAVRQPDLEALKRTHPHLRFQDFLATNAQTIWMRTDQPPFTDVRVRRAISHAIDRQGMIEAVWMRGEPSPAVPRGLTEWSLPIEQLGEGARYYRYDPKEARRLLAEAGYAKGFKTTLTTTGGYGHDLVDAAQLALHDLKEVGIEAELKLQEYGAYMATTGQGKHEGMAMGPYALGWEPDSSLYGPYTPGQARNRGHVNDPKLAAMVQEQRRLKDAEARKQLIYDIQRYAAEQQYYVYLASVVITSSWQPYMKNYSHNLTFDYGSRVASLWLER
ncbi:MAG TPA: ABC transporter substrate-binding protein [Candidatus Tectomicrobia bacterium]|nr:ABC transporter substrate-binding protein [Candidatus Tectomicrobia bacterium]